MVDLDYFNIDVELVPPVSHLDGHTWIIQVADASCAKCGGLCAPAHARPFHYAKAASDSRCRSAAERYLTGLNDRAHLCTYQWQSASDAGNKTTM